MQAVPYEWRPDAQKDLPREGDKGHSWIVVDKLILAHSPIDQWKKNKLKNKIPYVYGNKIIHFILRNIY